MIRTSPICRSLLWACVWYLLACVPAWGGTRVEAILQRGFLRCGVTEHYVGFADRQPNGEYVGFEADLCRAVASALLGQVRVQFVPLQNVHEWLADPGIDLVFHRLTWTLQREAPGQIEFGPVVLYDGLGVLLDQRYASRPSQLEGRRVCVAAGRGPQAQAYLAATEQHWQLVDATGPASESSMNAEGCAGWIGERTELASRRMGFADPDRYRVSETSFGKEPLAPVLPSDDADFSRVVRWTVQALIEAEEHHVTQAMAAAGSQDWYDAGSGEALGIAPNWADRVVASVGNYGELYQRHLGPQALDLPRGINRLWTEGGLMYALPMHP